jgi:type II secretory pathway component PulC
MQAVGKDGKLAGVRVMAARSGSLARALGLAPGDVIESIDGRAIDDPAVLMDMYQQLGDTRRVDLGVRRKSGAVTLIYDLP